jgi:hypothetical protein
MYHGFHDFGVEVLEGNRAKFVAELKYRFPFGTKTLKIFNSTRQKRVVTVYNREEESDSPIKEDVMSPVHDKTPETEDSTVMMTHSENDEHEYTNPQGCHQELTFIGNDIEEIF